MAVRKTRVETLSRAIGAVGGFGAFCGIVILLAGGPDAPLAWTILIAGLAASGYSVRANHRSLMLLSRTRQARIILNLMIMGTLLAAFTVFVNYLSVRRYVFLDLTEKGRFTLHPETVEILGELDRRQQNLIALALWPESNEYYERLEDLEKLIRRQTDRIEFRFVDYGDVGMIERYGLGDLLDAGLEMGMVVQEVLPKGDARTPRRQIFEESDLVYDEWDPHRQRMQFYFTGESALVAAVQYFGDVRPLTLYQMVGHGETDFRDAHNPYIGRLRRTLPRLNVEIATVDPECAVPDTAAETVLMLFGPRDALPARDLRWLDEYVDRGGNLLLLIDPPTYPDARRSQELNPLLGRFGLALEPYMVIDVNQSYSMRDINYRFRELRDTPLVFYYSEHPVVRKLGGRTAFPRARMVRMLEMHDRKAAAEWLLRVGPDGEKVDPVTGQSLGKGKFCFGAAAENARTGSRLVLIGDSDFPKIAQGMQFGLHYKLPPANYRLFANAVNWLGGRAGVVEVLPRDDSDPLIRADAPEIETVFYLIVVLAPLASLLAGALVYSFRK